MSINIKNKFFRHKLIFILILLIYIVSFFGCENLKAKKTSHNLILIVVDAMRADHLGAYGYSRQTTPNIDRLAQNALVSFNAHSQSNWTCTAMASLFTGTYPAVHMIYNSFESGQNRYSLLPDQLTIIPEALKQKNLYTAAVTSCGWVSPHSNYDQGFDDFLLVERKDDVIIDTSLPIITAKKNENFFLYIHLLELHDYYFFKNEQNKFLKSSYNLSPSMKSLLSKEPSEVYQTLSQIRDPKDLPGDDLNFLLDVYDSYLFYTDQLIGKIIQTLEDNNLSEKTTVIITADHGENFLEHNRLLHGGEGLYNEVTHIPLIFHNPSLFPEKRVISEPVEIIDIFPTILDLFDIGEIRVGDINQIQGDSLLSPNPNKTIFIENAARNRNKIIRENWSYILHRDTQKRELYNLEEDPFEQINLAEQEKIVVKKMHKYLLRKIDDAVELSQHIIPSDAKI
ncbi:MAG: sulfatase-like hydrolase/transferase, partial [Candidatus Aminicenantes bacterium]|nr:sulfatase-like hydrolase/transferase [Candidatus Aminicenantes bacterium]